MSHLDSPPQQRLLKISPLVAAELVVHCASACRFCNRARLHGQVNRYSLVCHGFFVTKIMNDALVKKV